MTTTFINTDYQFRVWPDLVGPDGVHTLALDSEETADLDLSPEFEDTYLKPVSPAAPRAAAKPADPFKNSEAVDTKAPETAKEQ